jgi:hypothetical protein
MTASRYHVSKGNESHSEAVPGDHVVLLAHHWSPYGGVSDPCSIFPQLALAQGWLTRQILKSLIHPFTTPSLSK